MKEDEQKEGKSFEDLLKDAERKEKEKKAYYYLNDYEKATVKDPYMTDEEIEELPEWYLNKDGNFWIDKHI